MRRGSGCGQFRAAAGKAAAPKPKPIAAVRTTRMAKKSPTGNANAGPQPRPTRRAFGTARSSNAPVEKPPPKLQKPSKVSPPPPQKPVKVSPPPLQKHSKLSPPAMQKPSKLSPINPVRATKPSRPVAKPLKKTAPGADLEAKAKKRGQRVSFQVAAVESAAPGSREKVKAAADDPAGHTPMVAMKASEKPSKVMAETPFFSAQNCSSCTLDQLESAAYWLAQIRLAESDGKHWVAAAFFRLALECQAQPIHRIQSELRNYSVRHEVASTVAPLFDELLTAHGMLVNQPSGIIQSECRSSIENLTPRGSTIHTSGRLSLDNPFGKKSPLLSKRLTSTCPSHKKSVSVRDQSSKRIPSGIHSDGKHTVGVTEHKSKITQDMGSELLSLFDQFESEEPVEDTVNNELLAMCSLLWCLPIKQCGYPNPLATAAGILEKTAIGLLC
ncbi:hypothetical protein PR202_gb19492 [Eleusine coracana subsp. coracana]|uniref:Uncharacterized protein n=1 Tax=Eleusine coracana subsp. coracana TaxID=191504 RepID=A0AAV5F8Z0_ELECO|nr:hypothetical protein PR202_gb19492 [Eleusine coracana subsp. coracana]